MTDQRLTISARRQAVGRLEQIEAELVQLSSWLAMVDQDRAALLLEDAATAAGAAGWELDRPLRASRRVT
jgi:hypothetical protein